MRFRLLVLLCALLSFSACDNNDNLTGAYNIVADNDVVVEQGSSSELNVILQYKAGPHEPVDLSVSGLPAGVTVQFSAVTGVPTFASTLTFSADAGAIPGDYPIKIMARSTKIDSKIDDLVLHITEFIPPVECGTKMSGMYTTSDLCGFTSPYEMVINPIVNTQNMVRLENLRGIGVDVDAELDCDNHTVMIPLQTANGASVSGHGTFDDSTMTIHYQMMLSAFTDSCTATLIRH